MCYDQLLVFAMLRNKASVDGQIINVIRFPISVALVVTRRYDGSLT